MQTALVIANHIWSFFVAVEDDMKRVSGVTPLLSVPNCLQIGEALVDPDHIYVDREMCGGCVEPIEAGGAIRSVGAGFRGKASGVAQIISPTEVSVDATEEVGAHSS